MFVDDSVYIEDEDQCNTCEYFLTGIMCPLLEALATGIAFLDGDVYVKNCGFYVPHVRHLSIVRDSGPTD